MPKKATLKAATKERDAERSKQALLEAAQRLFSGRGYTEVSVRDIAADAGINPALVSYYFGSKKALFAMALDELMHTEYFASLDRDRFGAELVDRISRASSEQAQALPIIFNAITNVAARMIPLTLTENKIPTPILHTLL